MISLYCWFFSWSLKEQCHGILVSFINTLASTVGIMLIANFKFLEIMPVFMIFSLNYKQTYSKYCFLLVLMSVNGTNKILEKFVTSPSLSHIPATVLVSRNGTTHWAEESGTAWEWTATRTAALTGPGIDQITIKTPNPKCRLYRCLIEFIDWRYSRSCWYFDPAVWTIAPTFFSVHLPPPLSCGNEERSIQSPYF